MARASEQCMEGRGFDSYLSTQKKKLSSPLHTIIPLSFLLKLSVFDFRELDPITFGLFASANRKRGEHAKLSVVYVPVL